MQSLISYPVKVNYAWATAILALLSGYLAVKRKQLSAAEIISWKLVELDGLVALGSES